MARAVSIYANSETARLQDSLGQALGAGDARLLFAETVTITLAVVDADNAAVDLTGNTTGWNLAIKNPADLDGATLLAAKAGTVLSATGGTVTFAFSGTDLKSAALSTYLADPLPASSYGKPVAIEFYRMPASDKTTYGAGTITVARGGYDTDEAVSGAVAAILDLTLKNTPLGADSVPLYSVADADNRRALLSTLPVSTPQAAAIAAGLNLSESIDGLIVQPDARAYTLVSAAKYALTLGEITIRTSQGTLTAALAIDGTPVGAWGALAVTATPQTVAATSANSLAAGTRLTLTLSSLASVPLDLEWSIKGLRA
jgi:hypothetical protein